MLLGVCLGGPVPWGFRSRAAFVTSPGGRRSVWASHPTSSDEFLIQLAFTWLSPTVLGLISIHVYTGVCIVATYCVVGGIHFDICVYQFSLNVASK